MSVVQYRKAPLIKHRPRDETTHSRNATVHEIVTVTNKFTDILQLRFKINQKQQVLGIMMTRQ